MREEKMKKLLSLVLALIMMVGMTACQTAEEKQNEVIDIKPLVVVITDVGGIGDHSFNDAALEALEAAKKNHNINIQCLEASQLGEYEEVITEAVLADAVLTVAVGSNMEEDLEKVAKEYPDKYFGIVDGNVDCKNVYNIRFADNESSYLAGFAAASTTKTGKIGFISGDDRETAQLFYAGYVEGAKAADPSVEVKTATVGSFYDAQKGYDTAWEMFYYEGTDVIMHMAGPSGIGVINAAKENDFWAIGADQDQSILASKNVLCSSVKDMTASMDKMVEMAVNGNFEGASVVYNMADGGVALTDNAGNIPADLAKEIDKIKVQIESGELLVPEKAGEEAE